MSDPVAAFKIHDGALDGGLLLLCDHARNWLPDEYGTLGLPESELERHIAYDIGAEALTLALAERLEAPVVQTTFSRLLVDPNRGEDDPTIVMRLSDGTVVPGNHPISAEEITARIEHYHRPYHDAVDETLDAMQATGVHPIVFSIHSYTPVWRGIPRPWHVGLLWDRDDRLPRYLIDRLSQEPGLIVGDNEPYDGALRNDTMYRHATKRGLAQALLELRNDLIAEPQGVAEWADRLAPLLDDARQQPDMSSIMHQGSRTDARAVTGESP